MGYWMYCFFFVLLSCMIYRKHLLSIFICLEFLSVMLSWAFIIFFNFMGYGVFFVMFFFVFSVCEACFGLGLLVNYVRLFGYDSCFVLDSLD
uniref:NADH-ubiquinone oxidoreductase chain 4L n=1 Tax=Echinoderes svetlanae TaxID=1912903 RepID=A0A1I9VTU4_9BILA|nr:NADH dehydrogenase subunit 4L [Echinoderes svetlanae]APA17417.1 NADH dehydrogenase subunit 4L [Echinoderes svetlanae]